MSDTTTAPVPRSRGYDPRWDRYLRGRDRDRDRDSAGAPQDGGGTGATEDTLRHQMLQILEPWGSRRISSQQALQELRTLADRVL